MLHTIRHSMDYDAKFRSIFRGLNSTFYHQTVTTAQIENYISKEAGFNYSKVFDQYLRTVQIPVFEYYFSDDHQKVFYQYTNYAKGFNLPQALQDNNAKVKILATEEWKSDHLKKHQDLLFDQSAVEAIYYITLVPRNAADKTN